MTDETVSQEITSYSKHRPDFNSSQRLTNVPLNGKNYIPWVKSARVSLKGKGLLGFITGDKKRPDKSGDAQEDWDIADGQTVTLVMNSLEPQLSEIFCYYDTAVELWQAIENQYSNQKNHSHVYHLKKEIAKLSQENRSIPELIGHVRAKYQELQIFRPSTTDLEVLKEREETDQVYTFLAALDSSYEAIRAQILLSERKLTFANVTALVQQEDSRRAAMSISDPNPRSENHAFSASVSYKGKGKWEKERCAHCNRDGHSQDKCWILHPHLRPRRGGDRKKGEQREGEKRGFSAARERDEGLETLKNNLDATGLRSNSDSTQNQLSAVFTQLAQIQNFLGRKGMGSSLLQLKSITGPVRKEKSKKGNKPGNKPKS